MRRIARLNGIVHVICTGDELTVQQASDKTQGEPEIYPLLFTDRLEMVGVSIRTPDVFNSTYRGETYEHLEGWRFLDWDNLQENSDLFDVFDEQLKADQDEHRTDLRARFAAADKTPRQFILWATGMGHKVGYATVSRHMAGTQGITTPWAIAYDCFFASLEK